jgi:hypothetical protein
LIRDTTGRERPDLRALRRERFGGENRLSIELRNWARGESVSARVSAGPATIIAETATAAMATRARRGAVNEVLSVCARSMGGDCGFYAGTRPLLRWNGAGIILRDDCHAIYG